MSKRIKSFLISIASFAITAFGVLVFTPQWADFVTWASTTFQSYLVGHGLPVALVVVIALFIAEVWKQILNKYISSRGGYSRIVTASRQGEDLY